MMTSTFARFPPRLQQAIAARLGWTELRPVQELAGQGILDGQNCLILAPTAGGKTEASIFPVLANLMEREPEGVGLIYIAPIKALLNNQAERLGTYSEMVGLSRFVWHGDVKASHKRQFIKEPAHILMTTPESLEVMLLSAKVPHAKLFGDLRAIIIDEIHALAESDRGTHLLSVFERLIRHTKNDVQRIGLSATVGNPQTILNWMQGTSQRSGTVIDPPKQPSPKDLRIYLRESTGEIAQLASKTALGYKSLCFCQSRSLAESMAERMGNRGIDVFVHHSSVSVEERAMAEERFHQGTNTSIVCTSTLELGIDVGDLDFVFQIDAPSTVSSFLQRLGRTGRRQGQRANTTFFCQNTETVLQAIAVIELAKKGWVESVPSSDRVWPVLVHQLLALTLEFGGISAERCWQILSVIGDFSGIKLSEFEALITHLITEEFLFESGGLLSIGTKAEKVFGRKNFMELYAVFTNPQLYQVKNKTGYIIGSLEQTFVDQLVEEVSCFLLGGRAWTINQINHSERLIMVMPASGGKKPSWGGFIPQLLSFEICHQIAEVLKEDIIIPYIDGIAQDFVNEWRKDLAFSLNQLGLVLRIESEQILWWTFAGGKINNTIKYGLLFQQDWKITVDNFRIRIEGKGVNSDSVKQAILAMSCQDFWNSTSMIDFLQGQLPNYRLSKFQLTLPKRFALEMISTFLLDISETIKFLEKLIDSQQRY